MVNIEVRIGALRLKNPVMVASGTFGEDYNAFFDPGKLGAVVTKTITLNARAGNPPPRVAETASGMLNSIGLENKGVEYFAEHVMPFVRRLKTIRIVSIAGNNAKEFSTLAARLTCVEGIDAIELNLSCPNIRYGVKEGLIAHNSKLTFETVKAVKKAAHCPIIAKLSPNVTDIVAVAKAAETAGADALSLTNTFIGMAIDVKTMRPKLGNIRGGLSGPAVKPLSLRAVWDVYKEVGVPIIGIGGIATSDDALEFMLAGARAVQVGTALFANPRTPLEVIDGIKEYAARRKIKNVVDIIGKAHAI